MFFGVWHACLYILHEVGCCDEWKGDLQLWRDSVVFEPVFLEKTYLCYKDTLNSLVNYRTKWKVCMSTEVLQVNSSGI